MDDLIIAHCIAIERSRPNNGSVQRKNTVVELLRTRLRELTPRRRLEGAFSKDVHLQDDKLFGHRNILASKDSLPKMHRPSSHHSTSDGNLVPGGTVSGEHSADMFVRRNKPELCDSSIRILKLRHKIVFAKAKFAVLDPLPLKTMRASDLFLAKFNSRR